MLIVFVCLLFDCLVCRVKYGCEWGVNVTLVVLLWCLKSVVRVLVAGFVVRGCFGVSFWVGVYVGWVHM